jgi:hypothetical protein
MNALPEEIHSQLLRAFRRAAEGVPAYRELCREQGVSADRIVDVESFSRYCPLLARANTFDRFPIDRLCHGGEPGDLAQVLTSSGQAAAGISPSACPTENRPPVQPENLVLWPYAEFPFGMGLDYERKFTYYVPQGAVPSVP